MMMKNGQTVTRNVKDTVKLVAAGVKFLTYDCVKENLYYRKQKRAAVQN